MYETLAQAGDPTIVSILITAVSTLAGVVAYLWRTFLKTIDDLNQRAKDCEDDREQLWNALIAQAPAAATVRKTK